MAPIDACALTLATCNEPLLTAHGVLYDKEPIFAYMLERKKKIERDLRAYNAQQAADTSAARVAEHALHERRVEQAGQRESGGYGVTGAQRAGELGEALLQLLAHLPRAGVVGRAEESRPRREAPRG